MDNAIVAGSNETQELSDALLIRTFLPVIPWFIIEVGGFPESARPAISKCFVPPSQSLSRELVRDFSCFYSEGLRHATERRRLRRWAMRRLAPHIEEIRPWFRLNLRDLVPEGEWQYDPSRIRKIVDTEHDINDHFIRAEHELMESVPDGSLLIEKSRRHDELALLREACLVGGTVRKPGAIRRDSPVWSILGIDPDESMTLPPREDVPLFLRCFLKILGVGTEAPDETQLQKLSTWWIERHLPSNEPTVTTETALKNAAEVGLVHVMETIFDKDTGEPIGETEVEDRSDRTRFVRQVEVKDELDRMVARARLSSGERLVLMGMRKGYDGEGLAKWVEALGQGIKRSSVPVLANRVRTKLRAALKE